jgi:hypothetical protein
VSGDEHRCGACGAIGAGQSPLTHAPPGPLRGGGDDPALRARPRRAALLCTGRSHAAGVARGAARYGGGGEIILPGSRLPRLGFAK